VSQESDNFSKSGGGATRLLSRDGDVEELYGNTTVGPAPRSGPEVKNRSSAEDGAPERLRCVSGAPFVRRIESELEISEI